MPDEAAPALAQEAPEAPPAPEPLQPPDKPDPEGNTPFDRRARATEIIRRSRKAKDAPEPAAEAKPEPGAAEEPEKADAAAAEEQEEPSKPDATEDEKPTGKDWKRLRREKQMLAQQARQIERERQELALAKAEKEADDKLKAEDPYAWARKHGLSFRDLAKKAVGEETKDPRDAAIEDLKRQIAELSGFKETFEERQQKSAVESARANVFAEASSAFAATSADDFPYLHAHGADQVAEAITRERIAHFKKTGEDVSPSEVMAALERNLRAYDDRLAAARNRGRPAPPPAEASPVAAAAAEAATGDISTRRVATRASDAGPLSAEERRQRAKAAVRNRTGRFG